MRRHDRQQRHLHLRSRRYTHSADRLSACTARRLCAARCTPRVRRCTVCAIARRMRSCARTDARGMQRQTSSAVVHVRAGAPKAACVGQLRAALPVAHRNRQQHWWRIAGATVQSAAYTHAVRCDCRTAVVRCTNVVLWQWVRTCGFVWNSWMCPCRTCARVQSTRCTMCYPTQRPCNIPHNMQRSSQSFVRPQCVRLPHLLYLTTAHALAERRRGYTALSAGRTSRVAAHAE